MFGWLKERGLYLLVLSLGGVLMPIASPVESSCSPFSAPPS